MPVKDWSSSWAMGLAALGMAESREKAWTFWPCEGCSGDTCIVGALVGALPASQDGFARKPFQEEALPRRRKQAAEAYGLP